PGQGPEDRQATGRGADRPREGGLAGHRHAHPGRGHGRHAVRWLHQPLRHGEPLVPRHPAGAPQRPPQRRPAAQLLHPHPRRRAGAAVDPGHAEGDRAAADAQALPAAQRGGDHLRPAPGRVQGRGAAGAGEAAAEVLPQGYSVDYAGESRQYKQEGATMLVTLGFALVAIFLVLAAQFESFRDALIMLVTVPMAISGALLVLNFLALVAGALQIAGIEAFP